MKFYFAGSEDLRFQEILKSVGVKKCLVSYYYVKNKYGQNARVRDIYTGMNEIFLDSGAYTAYHQGIEINVNDYIDFIKNNSDVTVYANLDVIGSWKKSMQNQMIMEKEGLRPLPVWHMHDSFSELQQLVGSYDYIAVSVSQSESDDIRAKVAATIFENFPSTKFHMFALTQPKLIIEHPFYSVDSTTWLNSGKYGALITPWCYLHIGKSKSRGHFDFKSREEKIKWQVYLKEKGFDIATLMRDDEVGYKERLRCSAKFFLSLEEAINSFPQPPKTKKTLHVFFRGKKNDTVKIC